MVSFRLLQVFHLRLAYHRGQPLVADAKSPSDSRPSEALELALVQAQQLASAEVEVEVAWSEQAMERRFEIRPCLVFER
jgi:hypothetical protein